MKSDLLLTRTAGFFVATILTAFVRPACAHEDPTGEIRPVVIPRKDRFEVYFHDNRERETPESPGRAYRWDFNLDGTELAPRKPYPGTLPSHESFRSPPEIGAAPDTFKLRAKGGRETTHRIADKQACDWDVVGWPSPSQIVVQFTRYPDEEFNPEVYERLPFNLGLFDLRTDELTHTVEVGHVGRIWSFAVASPVLAKDDKFYIAWVETRLLERKKETLNDGTTADIVSHLHRVVLSRWDPKSESIAHLKLSYALSDNAALSIASQGDQLMIAWHDMGRIRTKAIDLNTASFVEKLPPLEYDPKAEAALMRDVPPQ